MLVTELIQDIKDNGKLDCLRKPLPAPTDRIESELEKKYRLEAAWDTGMKYFKKIKICKFMFLLDCAFEADYDWMKPLKEKFGLTSGLVDRDGKSVER
jgi:hypothetical protein